MEETCPSCHAHRDPTDFYCRNCGKNLHPKPPSMTLVSLITLFLGGVLLPPFGIFWALPYIKEGEMKYKIVGYALCGVTIISLLVVVQQTMQIINSVSSGVSGQLQQLQGL